MATPPSSEHPEDSAINGSAFTYGPPFDDDDADVILRSSDRVDFLVYKVILSKASPVFKTMFSLPQPANAANIPPDSRPIIDLAETHRILATLLLSIYPHSLPLEEPFFLNNFITLLDAARKYDMTTAIRRLMDWTGSKVLRDSPLEAFCAAYSHGLGEAAHTSARASLKHRLNLDDIGEKLKYMNGPVLHALWKYHRACSAAAIKCISTNSFTWITPVQATWSSDTNCDCAKHRYKLGPARTLWSANVSWKDYIERARVALKEHPCSEAVTNQGILRPSYKDRMCDECRQRIRSLSEFSRMLGEEVERIVSNVSSYIFLGTLPTYFP
jgi:BTB/POZ domain